MMGKLLKFELRKVFRGKNIYICTGVSVLLVILSALILKAFGNSVDSNPTTASLVKSCLNDMNVLLLSAIFISIYVSEDFSLGTIKNVLGKGYSKDKIYFAKYIVCLIATMIMSVACLLFSYLFGVIFCNHDASLGKDVILSVLVQLIVVISYLSLYFFVSMSVGKLAFSVAINLVAPGIVSLVLTLVDSLTKWEKFHFSDYWLKNMMSSLQASETSNKSMWIAFIGGLVYIAICLVAGFFINRKREIK